MFGLLPVLLGSQLWFGGEDPVGGRPWYHEMLTWQAARDADWTTGVTSGTRFDFGSAVIDRLDPPMGEHSDAARPGRPPQSSAAAALAWHADYLDSYLYNPLWWAAGGTTRFKVAVLHRDELVKLHFDDLTSTRQIAATWTRIEQGTVAALLWVARRAGRHDPCDLAALARHVVAASLHALQDFYSHSNWVDDATRRETTWATMPAAVRNVQHLYTGGYEQPPASAFRPHGKFALDCALLRRLPADLMAAICGSRLSPFGGTSLCERWRACQEATQGRPPTVAHPAVPPEIIMLEPPGIANDSLWMSRVSIDQRSVTDRHEITGDDLFVASYRCARSHSTAWLQELAQLMHERGHDEFWNQVRSADRPGAIELPLPDDAAAFVGTYRTDIRQWEEPWRSAFTYLTAGTYPPAADGTDDSGWFVRLDVTTGSRGTSLWAGTDSTIAIALDDRPHEVINHRPGGDGAIIDPLIEHDDFRPGMSDSFVVGPFRDLPRRVVLHNASAPGVLQLIDAALWDLVGFVDTVKEIIIAAVRSLISGDADVIGATTVGYSWSKLDGMAAGVAYDELIRVGRRRGKHTEGVYDLHVQLICAPTDDGLRVSVRGLTAHCIHESTVDYWSTSDEPIVQVMVTNAATGDRRAWQRHFNHVSTGSRRDLAFEHTFDVPTYGGLIIGVQMLESDFEGIEGRKDLYEKFIGSYVDETEFGRLAFVETLGAMVSPDWLLDRLEIHAFRRSPVAELVTLVDDRPVRQWLKAGTSLEIPLDTALPSGPTAKGDTMRPGEVLRPGGQLWSSSGRYMMTYQTDGNLVLYGPAGALWASNTAGTTGGVLIMQYDGNLVIYNHQGHPFDTGSWGHPGAWLVLQDDGRLVVRDHDAEHFTTPTGVPVVRPPLQGNRLLPGEGLYPGQSLWSPSSRYALWYETGGNLVLHGPAGVVRFLHECRTRPGAFMMSPDGALVVVEPGVPAVVIGGPPGTVCYVQDDAKVSLYALDGSEIWQSGTGVEVGPVATSPYMRPGEILYPDGRGISSPEGEYSLILQADGNLVIDRRGRGATWGAGTENSPAGAAIFDYDGNLRVMAYGSPKPLFQTHTSRNGRDAFLMIRDDGKLTINIDDEVVWERPQ